VLEYVPTMVLATVSLPAHELTPDELEHSYAIQRKALRILVCEGRSLTKIRRTACWLQLETLHGLDPRRYRQPEQLHDQLHNPLHNQLHNQLHDPRASVDR